MFLSKRDRRTDLQQLPLRLPSVLFIVFTQFFCFHFVCPYGSPPSPAIPSQGERSLEDHARQFFLLAHTTSYTDDALCVFYDASLNTTCRALSSEDGPRVEFAAFVEWTLARNGSPLTISPEDDLARSTPAHHLPAVRSTSPSPPLMESHFQL